MRWCREWRGKCRGERQSSNHPDAPQLDGTRTTFKMIFRRNVNVLMRNLTKNVWKSSFEHQNFDWQKWKSTYERNRLKPEKRRAWTSTPNISNAVILIATAIRINLFENFVLVRDHFFDYFRWTFTKSNVNLTIIIWEWISYMRSTVWAWWFCQSRTSKCRDQCFARWTANTKSKPAAACQNGQKDW